MLGYQPIHILQIILYFNSGLVNTSSMADHLKTISAERLTQAVNEAVNAHHEVHKPKQSFLSGQ